MELRFWDYTKAGETKQQDSEIDINKMVSMVQSTAGTANKTDHGASFGVQLPTGKRRASLGKWLGGRKSTPNATAE